MTVVEVFINKALHGNIKSLLTGVGDFKAKSALSFAWRYIYGKYCPYFNVPVMAYKNSHKIPTLVHSPPQRAVVQGRIGTYNFVVPGLSQPLF